MPIKLKRKLIGIIITGTGLLLVPFTMNKYLMALDCSLFVYFCFSALTVNMKQANLTISDFINDNEEKISKTFKAKDYKLFILYGSVVPAMGIGIIMLVLMILSLLI